MDKFVMGFLFVAKEIFVYKLSCSYFRCFDPLKTIFFCFSPIAS